MQPDRGLSRPNISRRAMLGAAAAVAATPALAEECRIGPPPHPQGPSVWLNMDQVELDASYDQSVYAPLGTQVIARCVANSELVRKRLGPPQRVAYGPTEIEKLDIYRTKAAECADLCLHSRRRLDRMAAPRTTPMRRKPMSMPAPIMCCRISLRSIRRMATSA